MSARGDSGDVAAGETLADVLFKLSSETWLEFLEQRRWFPAGARAVRLVGAAPLGDEAALCLLAIAAGRPWMTQVLLKSVPLEEDPERHGGKDMLVRCAARERALVEAVDAPEVFAALHASLRAGARLAGRGASWIARATTTWADDGCVRVIGADQSNTAVVFGEAGIFKLYRRVEVGPHPEIELGRFLTARGFPFAPPLLAELSVETDEGPAAAGVVHAYLPGRVDGWTYALGRDDMRAEARALGVATRALHEALASGDAEGWLSARPIAAADRERWVQALRATAAIALERLAASRPDLPARAQALADAVAAASEALLADAQARLRGATGVQIRVHGDYHLGQVLFDTSSGTWSILDFEGEPTRPLAERCRRQLPLRDVAGMLRSFAYAGMVGGGGPAWERATSEAFLAGYDEAAEPGSPLPPAQASPLLRACLLERTFHELAYELDYRPQHAWIPLESLAAMAASRE
ncbi:MAG TPA: phosphotransferase [Nannocystis sp.]